MTNRIKLVKYRVISCVRKGHKGAWHERVSTRGPESLAPRERTQRAGALPPVGVNPAVGGVLRYRFDPSGDTHDPGKAILGSFKETATTTRTKKGKLS